jgi:Spy/CpxP family protein refolding chaperone
VKPLSKDPPSKDPPLDGPEFQFQGRRDWWNRAHEVLFVDIELSAEQAHAVDGIIEAQLNTRALLHQRDAELKTARKTRDSKRIDAAREEVRAIQKQLKKLHEIYEEMRAVLTEEQRPAFDMGRARHAAEMQGPGGRIRPGERAEQAEKE